MFLPSCTLMATFTVSNDYASVVHEIINEEQDEARVARLVALHNSLPDDHWGIAVC